MAAEGLVDLIKLRTFPFGMKLFENVDDMLAIKGLRTPSDGKFFTTCQLESGRSIQTHIVLWDNFIGFYVSSAEV